MGSYRPARQDITHVSSQPFRHRIKPAVPQQFLSLRRWRRYHDLIKAVVVLPICIGELPFRIFFRQPDDSNTGCQRNVFRKSPGNGRHSRSTNKPVFLRKRLPAGPPFRLIAEPGIPALIAPGGPGPAIQKPGEAGITGREVLGADIGGSVRHAFGRQTTTGGAATLLEYPDIMARIAKKNCGRQPPRQP